MYTGRAWNTALPGFRDYLSERNIEETSLGHYRVPCGKNRLAAIFRLDELSDEMLIAFGVVSTGVLDTKQSPLEFVNRCGIFYVDDIKEQ